MHIDGRELETIESTPDRPALVQKVAEYAGMTSGYLQAHSFDEMLSDANRLIRRVPEHSLATAAAAGLLLGFAMRRK